MNFFRRLFLRRNVVALLAFLGSVNIYILRANLSIAIIAMTQTYETVTVDGSVQYIQDYNWNSKEKGNILGSFFYGYVSTQVIGGWLGEKIGGARLFGIGVLITAVLNTAIPLAVYLGTEFLIFVRVMEGVFEGVTYPCLHVVWSRWAPAQERTRLASSSFAGIFAGTVVAFPLCGFLAQSFGWPSIFYITGAIAFLWCFIWLLAVKNDPEDDPWISEVELKYIQESVQKPEKVVYPWKSIITSMPVWAILCGHTCEGWGFYTLLAELPTFVHDTSNANIQDVGLLSAIPYFVMALTLPLSGFVADVMRRNDLFTTTQVRKTMCTIAFIGQAVFISSAVHMQSVYMIILCLTLALGIGACCWSSVIINHLDIAPQYAGVLMGITNTCAAIPGFVSPIVTGYIVQNKTKEEWRIVFYIISAIYVFGMIIFVTFASGERQPWADNKTTDKIHGCKEVISTPTHGNFNA